MKHGTRTLQIVMMLLAIGTISVAQAADEWRFGIGTGFSSYSLDGDVGFATPAGGVIADLDLDNSDTSDMMDSAFGFGAFATRGDWTFNFSFKTITLEDSDSGFKIEWDRTEYEAFAAYQFAVTGNHRWGVLAGVRGTDHDWTFKAPGFRASPDEDWTDAIVGLTHAVPINEKWSWNSRADIGFGDIRTVFELVLYPLNCGIHGPVVHPVDQCSTLYLNWPAIPYATRFRRDDVAESKIR